VAGVGTALSGLMSVFGPLWAGVSYEHLIPSAPFWSDYGKVRPAGRYFFRSATVIGVTHCVKRITRY
jgi:hypothetical protein